jgi:hypothetical protein
MDGLPPDVTLKILSYCALQELGSIALASRSLNVACSAPVLWGGLFLRDFNAACRSGDPRSEYSRRYGRHQMLVNNQVHLRSLAVKRITAAQLQATTGYRLAALAVVTALVLPFAGLLAIVCSVSAKLDGQTGSSWAVVFVPIWLMLCSGALWLLLLGGLAAWQHSRRRGSDALAIDDTSLSPWHGQLDRLSWLPCHALVTTVVPQRPLAAVHVFMVFFLLGAQMCLLCAKLSASDTETAEKQSTLPFLGDHDGFVWSVVGAPIWLVFLLLACIPCLWRFKLRSDSLKGFVATWLVLLCPLLATAIALAVSLDAGLKLPLNRVFIPLWIVLG